MGVFIAGENKIVTIGGIPNIGGYNGLEMILRESGRFITKYPDKFIALSEKKTRSITVSGSIGAASPAQHFTFYDDTQGNVYFETADIYPQDLLNKYDIEDIEIYGIATLLNMSLGSEPGDAVCRLLGAPVKYWVSRQPLTSWNYEDCVGIIFSAYQTIPQAGIQNVNEGVVLGTTKKNLLPIFTPIKSSLSFTRDKDKLYLYSLCDILGYQAASTAGGSLGGSASLDQRIIVGIGYLPEEVEELLSPSQ